MSDTRSDERPHPAGTELGWCEAYWFELHDEASGLAGVTRLDVRPNEGTREATLSFFLSDGGFITARHVEPYAASDERLEVEGLSFAMVEPERRWRLTYDGPAHALGSVRDADKPDAWRKSRLERLIVELDLETLRSPIASAGGFAQPARFTGEVWVSGDRYELASLGLRGKSWGVAAVPQLARRVALTFGPDRALLVERSVHEAGEQISGWILRDGRVVRVVGIDLSTETEPGSEVLPRSFRLVLRDAEQGRHEITADLPHVAPLPGFRGGRDNLLCLGVARARWDGADGSGIVEYLHRLDAAGQPLEPVAGSVQKL